MDNPTPDVDAFEKELEEILAMAFVGLYTTNAEGDFVPVDDKYGVLFDALRSEVAIAHRRELERVIGADEDIRFDDGVTTYGDSSRLHADTIESRNELRAEQRTRAGLDKEQTNGK